MNFDRFHRSRVPLGRDCRPESPTSPPTEKAPRADPAKRFPQAETILGRLAAASRYHSTLLIQGSQDGRLKARPTRARTQFNVLSDPSSVAHRPRRVG